MKPSELQIKEKHELHLLRKEHYNGLRGPGSYPVTQKHTSFKKVVKPEQLQCFNTTASRFPAASSSNTEHTSALGPGSYDIVSDIYKRSILAIRQNTAAFLTRRPEDIFGIKDMPGP